MIFTLVFVGNSISYASLIVPLFGTLLTDYINILCGTLLLNPVNFRFICNPVEFMQMNRAFPDKKNSRRKNHAIINQSCSWFCSPVVNGTISPHMTHVLSGRG
jgi:hypothetical protein